MNHPKPSVLRNFLRSLPVADAGLLLHLVECPRCARQVWGLLTPRPVRRRPGEPHPPEAEPEAYERAFARMAEKVRDSADVVGEGRRHAAPLVAQLLALPPDARHERLEADPRFRTFFVGWELLERSWHAAGAAEAEALGRLAAEVAESLEESGSDLGAEAGLSIGAWCAVGDACRRLGDLEAAETAFRQAIPALEKSIDSTEAAEYCRWLARLRRDQRRFDEAAALLERSAALSATAGQARDQALALTDLAAVHLDQDDMEGALNALESVLALGPAAADPGLAVGATGGIAGCLAAFGDPLVGRRILAALAERPARRRQAVERAVLVRVEGLITAFSRQEHQAEVLLREAWNAFHRAGALGYAILAGLDMAALFLRQGRASNLRALGGEIRIAFQSRSVTEGVRSALDDLVRVLEAGAVSPEHLSRIARYIARAMAQPDLPYPG